MIRVLRKSGAEAYRVLGEAHRSVLAAEEAREAAKALNGQRTRMDRSKTADDFILGIPARPGDRTPIDLPPGLRRLTAAEKKALQPG